MSENEEPDWLAELTKNANALRQQIEESSEALRQQVDQLVRSAEQFARDGREATPGGPLPPLPQRLVQAAGSVMRGLVPVAGYSASYSAAYGGFRGQVRVMPTVTGSGSVALPPMRVDGAGEVVTTTETGTVEIVPDRPSGVKALSDGEIVFLVLVWIYAVWLPWFGARLPPELHGMLSDSYGTIAIALAITWRRLDKHNR
jgi:hypothetical protein